MVAPRAICREEPANMEQERATMVQQEHRAAGGEYVMSCSFTNLRRALFGVSWAVAFALAAAEALLLVAAVPVPV
jgi:hypothetical protein